MGLIRRTSFPIILAAILLSSCSHAGPTTVPGSEDEFPVDPTFQSFVSSSGGDWFGPALEAARRTGQRTRQTFLNVQLVYDPSMPQAAQVSLSPLGVSLGLSTPPVAAPTDPSGRYFSSTGHSLYRDFVAAYDKLGGERVAGPPIAEVVFGEGRTFQSFANLTLFHEAGDPATQVRLAALGLASMPDHRLDARYILPPGLRARPFGLFLDQYGAEAVFGPPLTDPYPAADGGLEQVYERAVLYAPAEAPGEVRLRPLGASSGPPAPPTTASSDTVGLYFPQTGHYVLWAFADFFRSHGGEKVLGLPLDEASPVKGVLTQRFENVVLEYHYELPPQLAVQLAPLGKSYQGLPGAPTSEAPTLAPTPTQPAAKCNGAVTIKTHTEYPILPLGGMQEISIEVLAEDGSPVAGLAPLVVVHGPNADTYPPVPPTDAEGKSQLALTVPGLKPGEIVNFEVVIAGESCTGYAIDQFAGGAPSP